MILGLLFLTTTAVAMAVPAKRGVWKTVMLADGTEVRAELRGDEHAHFWQTEDGRRLTECDGIWQEATVEQLLVRQMSRKAKLVASHAQKAPRKVTIGERTSYMGKKKGIVILAQYTDVKFKSDNNLAKYKRILNEEGYTTTEGFKGSVADYFKAQSGGLFELEFDVVGPYTMKYNRAYYGGNNSNDEDKNPDAMIVEACKAADAEVNFADYDWDGDGYVDQVFVLYAGTGEADSYDNDAIWPHMYELSATRKSMKLDGVTIDTYACSNEVDMYGSIEGIGCFCHEFSHCMGFPDFYDVFYEGNFGMSSFDLMEQGSYNGNGFLPAGYSGHEKMMCGWLEPVELDAENVEVSNLKPMSEGGKSYVIYNKAHPDEYYMLENRQKTGWDAGLPAKGLMITHVDFDKNIWEANIPNSIISASSEYVKYYGYPVNDHQRMTIFHADNNDDSKYWNSSAQTYSQTTLTTDLYPYQKNDSLTNTSKPAATLYNKNTDGTKFMNKKILGITQNSDRTMSFRFVGAEETVEPTPDPGFEGDTLFYETFDKSVGKGGNDDAWSGQVANSAFVADYQGWDVENAYGAAQCAKFGTGSKKGRATTPAIKADGAAILTFRAAAWNGTSEKTTLLLSVSNGTIEPESVTLAKGEWQEYTATLSGADFVTVTFESKANANNRFFLDDILVVSKGNDTGVNDFIYPSTDNGYEVYDLSGRRLEHSQLRKGIYIINGRKVVIR